ncbi:MAG: family 43 glycosylhydrolase [Clostridia bacterium]|nr:family 43 glycosylhydrolase [Clostridia bacterium]
MKIRQAFNPFLPSYEYIPDGEPHLFGDRVYLYGSHDKFNGKSFCQNDYVCWSAHVNDLTSWEYEGVIFRKKQDPHARLFSFINTLYAPDVAQGADGRYYLYYTLGYTSRVGVAVCDTPAGKFEFLGYVRYEDGTLLGAKGEPLQFDPGVFVDDDGQTYLYTGFAPKKYPRFLMKGHKPSVAGAMAMRLKEDMLTVEGDLKYIAATVHNSAGTGFEGHEFFEAPSMRKFNGRYYFIYSSIQGHELCYAVSNSPTEGFEYGGTLISIGDLGLDGNKKARNNLGNTHGSVIKIKYRYYVFYHRQTNRHQFSRQACAEEIQLKDGKFLQAELTSCGLNGRPLRGVGAYKARIACHLYSRKGARSYGVIKRRKGVYPYFTQSGKDRNHTPNQYIANFTHGATAGFKYFEFDGANQILITVKGDPHGKMIVSESPTGKAIAKIRLTPCEELTDFYAPLHVENGKRALYFTYEGTGSFIFKGFRLQQVTRGNDE